MFIGRARSHTHSNRITKNVHQSEIFEKIQYGIGDTCAEFIFSIRMGPAIQTRWRTSQTHHYSWTKACASSWKRDCLRWWREHSMANGHRMCDRCECNRCSSLYYFIIIIIRLISSALCVHSAFCIQYNYKQQSTTTNQEPRHHSLSAILYVVGECGGSVCVCVCECLVIHAYCIDPINLPVEYKILLQQGNLN